MCFTGLDLFLTDLSPVKLARLASGLERLHHVKVLYDPCDLADSEARRLFWQRINNLGDRFQNVDQCCGVDFEGAFMDRASHEIERLS